MSTNQQLAQLFDNMGLLLEVKGENVFKVRAYHKAADNIRALAEDIAILVREDRLDEVGGLGKALKEKAQSFVETGQVPAYDALVDEVPESILLVMNVPQVGPKKAKLFYQKLGVKDLAGLRRAAETGELLKLDGIREKTVANILKGLAVVEAGQERMNLGKATQAAEEIVAQLRDHSAVRRISVAGSLRRGRETVRDIDILVDSSDPVRVMELFVGLPQVKSVNVHGEKKSSVLTRDNIQVDVRVVEPDSFGAALLYFTGSKSFNVRLRQLAMKRGQKVNEYGVYRVKGEQETRVAGETETDCFKALGLPDIPPELREDIGEERIFGGADIPRLVELKDIRGDLHVHSTYSDGRHSIAQMAAAARERGYAYLAVSDHSEKLKVAGGLSPADLKKKRAEIDRLNAKFSDFRILFGTEAEIDLDGNIDYNEKILSEFDVVVASVHTGFDLPADKMTARLLKACANPHVDIIGHPTGVHRGKREPYDFDFKQLCQAAADHNTWLEINAFPVRLDLDGAYADFARQQGVRFVINTDAHAVEHFAHLRHGISIARRGWLTKHEVMNTRPLKTLLKELG